MGVVFFIINAAFALVLLILVLIASVYAIVSKNPDTRYQPMRDDRGSFIKSQTQLTTELDALGATARGDIKTPYSKSRIDDDEASWSSGSLSRNTDFAAGVPLPPSTANSVRPPQEPVEKNMPMFPSDRVANRAPPPNYNQGNYGQNDVYNGYNNNNGGYDSRSDFSRSQNASPAPRGYQYPDYNRTGSSHSMGQQFRQQNNSSPWQRGAGYER
jgi:hypothetical protein